MCPCVVALVSYVRVKKLRHTVSYPEDLNSLKHIYEHLISCKVQLLNELITFGVCTVFVSYTDLDFLLTITKVVIFMLFIIYGSSDD